MNTKKNKKYDPIRREPTDDVDTIYCDERFNSYDNIKKNDMFPYISPLPPTRRTPEPPII